MPAVPSHRQPTMREMGRRSEAADHPFKRDAGDTAPDRSTGAPDVGWPGHARPLVLTSQVGQRLVLAAACPAARRLGLSPGMAATQARALVSDLDVRPAEPDADRAELDRLALHAVRHWTPIAAVADLDGLWLELTGTTHLFGGEERFCRRVVRFLERLGLTARIAVAETPGAAHALARYGDRRVLIVPSGGQAQSLSPLPLASLRLGEDALGAAARFGIDRVGDLLPMPRGPLARRLGLGAVARLDQALGRVAEPIVPVVPFEPPQAERRLLEPICTAEAIAQVIADLLAELVATLRERGLGARSLVLVLLRVDGTEQRVVVGTSRATRDADHLVRLLSLQMDRIDPGFGIEIMRATVVRTDRLGALVLGALISEVAERPDVGPLVDVLGGRVEAAALFRLAPVESDVPERAVRRADPLVPSGSWPAWRRPVRLLDPPEPLANVLALLPDLPPRRFVWRGRTHVVVSGDGPERIHGEWWRRDGEIWAVRDYWRVEDDAGGRFWMFRRGDGVDAATGDLSWFMHGLFG